MLHSHTLHEAPLRNTTAYTHHRMMTYVSIATFVTMSSVLAIILLM